ncbi:MAG: UMP kinase [Patescibacteria group bacterium]
MLKPIVISLGGSMLVPDKINISYLKKFREFIKKNNSKYKFYLVTGGGQTCRTYQAAAKNCCQASSDDLDWIGIRSTRLNAELLRSVLGDLAAEEIFLSPENLLKSKRNVFVGGGWQPGNSTDFIAVYLAVKIKADTVINLSNIDYIYDRDPHRDPGVAKPIKQIDWSGLRKLIGNKWVPGSHRPFDQKACRLAEQKKIRVVFLNGAKLNNLDNFINNRKFKGTEIV